jgi:hypothetical protein
LKWFLIILAAFVSEISAQPRSGGWLEMGMQLNDRQNGELNALIQLIDNRSSNPFGMFYHARASSRDGIAATVGPLFMPSDWLQLSAGYGVNIDPLKKTDGRWAANILGASEYVYFGSMYEIGRSGSWYQSVFSFSLSNGREGWRLKYGVHSQRHMGTGPHMSYEISKRRVILWASVLNERFALKDATIFMSVKYIYY